mgnify:CR=1 FL=1
MKLVIAEKNIAAQKIAQLLSDAGKPKNDKVYNTAVYRFTVDGEEWVSMGLAGHILAPARLMRASVVLFCPTESTSRVGR